MVRAILEGRKTQTRRIVKFPLRDRDFGCELAGNEIGEAEAHRLCPYGKPGDRLWVRETWAPRAQGGYWYAADPETALFKESWIGFKWRPSIFMPRSASRITLEIIGVRVERLQEISEADALAEGIVRWDSPGAHYMFAINEAGDYNGPTARLVYQGLWDRINGVDSWASNPWVWVIEFKSRP